MKAICQALIIFLILQSVKGSQGKKLYSKSMVFENHKKVSFYNIASEASYVYILSGQKFPKNAKKRSILTSFCKPEACGQTVLPDRPISKAP